jgi:hypothetical protein
MYWKTDDRRNITLILNADGTNLVTFDLSAIAFAKFNGDGDFTFKITGFKAGGNVTTTFTTSHGTTAYTTGTYTNFTGITGFSIEMVADIIYHDVNTLDSFTIANVSASSNAAPTITGTTVNQAVNDNATVNLFSGVTIADADGADVVTATITPNASAKGVFTAASLTASSFVTGDSGVTYTHTAATPAAMTTAIRALVFDPTDNRVAPAGTETTNFTIAINDTKVTTTSTNTTSVVSTSVNDAPTDIALSSTSVNQSGGANAVVGTLSDTDADTGDGATYTLVAGAGDTNNASFNISGTNFRANNSSALSAGT